MKELLHLKSFQQILLMLFFLGLIIGALLGIYLFNTYKFRFILIFPSVPALYFISRGLYKNCILFFVDIKSSKITS